MKVVVISDTHNQHRKLLLPQGDMIIHCGDVSGRGTSTEVYDFVKWFSILPYKYKIFIAGNHDFYFEQKGIHELEDELKENEVIYLNDSGIEIEGVKFWGSPIQPWFYDWAFNRRRGEDIKRHWDKIPDDINILITHGPPANVLDLCENGESVGCKDLMNAISNKRDLKFHLFGHIHEGYGVKRLQFQDPPILPLYTQDKPSILNRIDLREVTFINASVLDQNYRLVNRPVIIEIK